MTCIYTNRHDEVWYCQFKIQKVFTALGLSRTHSDCSFHFSGALELFLNFFFSVFHWTSIFIVHFLFHKISFKEVGFLFSFLHSVVTISTNKTVIILSRWRPLWLVVFFIYFFGKGGGAIRWPVSSSSLQVKQRLVLLVCVDFVDQWGYKIPIP